MKSKWLVLLTIPFLFCGCAALQFQIKGLEYKSETYLESLRYFPTKTEDERAEKAEAVKLYCFFKELAESKSPKDSLVRQTFKQLQRMNAWTDSGEITAVIEAFKKKIDMETHPETPHLNEWWKEHWETRADYCNNRYLIYYDLGYEYWDMRAGWVLRLGIPDDDHCETDICWTEIKKPPPYPILCYKYYMQWTASRIFLAFQDDNGDDHPDRIIPHKDFDIMGNQSKSEQMLSQGVRESEYEGKGTIWDPYEDLDKVLEASFNISVFPEPLGIYTIGLSAGIPLDQFRPDSNGAVVFRLKTVIYEKDSVVMEDKDSCKIDIFSNPGIRWLPWYRGYILPDGEYQLVFTVENLDGTQMGVYLDSSLQVPPSGKGISDILLAFVPPRNDSTALGIKRRGNINIMDNPFSIFSPRDTLYPYFEFNLNLADFKPDKLGKYTYNISLYLSPIGRGKPEVETGHLRFIEVTKDGRTFKIEQKEKLKIEEEFSEEKDLIFSSGETTGLSTQIFTEPIRFPKFILPPGEYYLKVLIDDANSNEVLRTRRRIAIIK